MDKPNELCSGNHMSITCKSSLSLAFSVISLKLKETCSPWIYLVYFGNVRSIWSIISSCGVSKSIDNYPSQKVVFSIVVQSFELLSSKYTCWELYKLVSIQHDQQNHLLYIVALCVRKNTPTSEYQVRQDELFLSLQYLHWQNAFNW